MDGQTIALMICGPLLAIFIVKEIWARVIRVDAKVDEVQELLGQASGICRQAQLPLLEKVLRFGSSINMDKFIKAAFAAVNSVDTMPELIRAFEGNFIWQFDYRGKTDEGVKLIVDKCLDVRAIKEGIIAGLEAQKRADAEAEALAELQKQARASAIK